MFSKLRQVRQVGHDISTPCAILMSREFTCLLYLYTWKILCRHLLKLDLKKNNKKKKNNWHNNFSKIFFMVLSGKRTSFESDILSPCCWAYVPRHPIVFKVIAVSDVGDLHGVDLVPLKQAFFAYVEVVLFILRILLNITKTSIFKYTENLLPKRENVQIQIWIFSYFCRKHRLWVLVRTALF